jgi:tetratricopeptide (TPR) repeat protein
MAVGILGVLVYLGVGFQRSQAIAARRTVLARTTLDDGTLLLLDQITLTAHRFPVLVGGGPFDGGGRRTLTAHAEPNQMVLWFSRFDSTGREALDFDWWSHCVAIDDHGCAFRDDRPGRNAVSRYSSNSSSGSRPFQPLGGGPFDAIVAHSTLPRFRTSNPTFKLRVYDNQGTVVGELNVPTPDGLRQLPVWQPEPLPTTKSAGDLAVKLIQVRVAKGETYSNGAKHATTQLTPVVELTRDGKPATEWSRSSFAWLDAAGNTATPGDCRLCPRETAWKLRARFFRAADAQFDVTELCTVAGLPVPKPDEGSLVSQSHVLGGVTVAVLGVGGGGTVSYAQLAANFSGSHGGSGTVTVGDKQQPFSVDTRGDQRQTSTTVKCALPHIIGRITGLTEEHYSPELLVKDDRGRPVRVAGETLNAHHLRIWFLDVPAHARSLSVTFILQKGRTVEFLVAPPALEPLQAPRADPLSPAGQAQQANRLRPLIARLQARLQSNPADPGVCNELAWHYATAPPELRDPKQAVELAQRAVAAQPGNHSFVNTLTTAYYRNGQYALAVPLLEQNLLGRTNWLASYDLYVLAMCRQKLGDPDKAREAYRRALALQRQYAQDLSNVQARQAGEFQAEARLLLLGGPVDKAFQSADRLARKGAWKEAAAEFARVLELVPEEHWNWFRSACLYAETGDLDAYRQHCRRMLELFPEPASPFLAERSAKASMLLTGELALDPRVRALADRAVAGDPANAWFMLAKALAELRANQIHDALQWLDSIQSLRSQGPYCDALIRLVRAMAQQRAGQPDAAKKSLAEAVAITEQEQFPRLASGDLGDAWHDWLMVHLMVREAETLLGVATSKTKP